MYKIWRLSVLGVETGLTGSPVGLTNVPIAQVSHPVFRPKLNAFLYVWQDQISHIKRQIVE
jgi:hypothetical protein